MTLNPEKSEDLFATTEICDIVWHSDNEYELSNGWLQVELDATQKALRILPDGGRARVLSDENEIIITVMPDYTSYKNYKPYYVRVGEPVKIDPNEIARRIDAQAAEQRAAKERAQQMLMQSVGGTVAAEQVQDNTAQDIAAAMGQISSAIGNAQQNTTVSRPRSTRTVTSHQSNSISTTQPKVNKTLFHKPIIRPVVRPRKPDFLLDDGTTTGGY